MVGSHILLPQAELPGSETIGRELARVSEPIRDALSKDYCFSLKQTKPENLAEQTWKLDTFCVWTKMFHTLLIGVTKLSVKLVFNVERLGQEGGCKRSTCKISGW